jgi:hypothetical protein
MLAFVVVTIRTSGPSAGTFKQISAVLGIWERLAENDFHILCLERFEDVRSSSPPAPSHVFYTPDPAHCAVVVTRLCNLC